MSKTEDSLRECGRWICHSFNILKATLIRIIFALHATIAIIRIVVTKGDYWYLLNMCGVNFLLIELVVTVFKRKGMINIERMVFQEFLCSGVGYSKNSFRQYHRPAGCIIGRNCNPQPHDRGAKGRTQRLHRLPQILF